MKLCPSCDRHLFGPEPTCPFCGAEQATTAAKPSGALASLTLAFALGAAACGPIVEPEQTSGSSSSVGDETTVPPGTTAPPSTGITTVEPTGSDGTSTSSIETSSSSEDDNGDDAPCAFYAGCPPDIDRLDYECDLFAQDCPEGEKCMPWSNDGSETWNASRCVPIADDPDQPGDECTVEGSAYSGIDSCDHAVMCFDVDPATNQGTCVALCGGSEANPQCAGAEEICIFVGDVPLCAPSCHPLDPECSEGDGCYPAPEDGFVCWEPVQMGAHGDECEYVNDCLPGHTCVEAGLLPGCATAGCCVEYCDVAAGLPCPGADQGVTCVPWYEDGKAPAGQETVGTCTLPP